MTLWCGISWMSMWSWKCLTCAQKCSDQLWYQVCSLQLSYESEGMRYPWAWWSWRCWSGPQVWQVCLRSWWPGAAWYYWGEGGKVSHNQYSLSFNGRTWRHCCCYSKQHSVPKLTANNKNRSAKRTYEFRAYLLLWQKVKQLKHGKVMKATFCFTN